MYVSQFLTRELIEDNNVSLIELQRQIEELSRTVRKIHRSPLRKEIIAQTKELITAYNLHVDASNRLASTVDEAFGPKTH